MKRTILSVLVAGAVMSAAAWVPTFTEGWGKDTLKVDGKAICDDNDSLTFPSPVFADWDGDGLDDMILGYWHSYIIKQGQGGGTGGAVRFLKNIGSTSNPEFTDKGNLFAGGEKIKLEAA